MSFGFVLLMVFAAVGTAVFLIHLSRLADDDPNEHLFEYIDTVIPVHYCKN
jgi:hypothetical protein